jgi:hypothetical protein
MLPRSKPNDRLLALQAKVDACTADDFASWPEPTKDDLSLMGGYILLFNYIDLNLRRMAEILELAGKLPKPLKGGVAALSITDVEGLLLATDLSDNNRIAFENISEFRGMRNLLAHFAIKRFPQDDAFVLMTKSTRDYRREFGREPPPGVLFTAVFEVPTDQGCDASDRTPAALVGHSHKAAGRRVSECFEGYGGVIGSM